MADHYLVVPPTGLLEVIHADDPLDPNQLLLTRGAEGAYVRLSHDRVTASWYIAEGGEVNLRALQAFARAADVHFMFTGTVIFEGIDEQMLGEIVGRLSLRDTAGGL